MNKRKILYICDLNLSNGGAQRVTIETLPQISKAFDIFLYMPNNPSSDSSKILESLEIKVIIDFSMTKEKVRDFIRREKIDLVLIQWENPKWILLCHQIWKEMKFNYTIFLYELPLINTPTKNYFGKWYIHAYFKIPLKTFKNLIRAKQKQVSKAMRLNIDKIQMKKKQMNNNSFFLPKSCVP